MDAQSKIDEGFLTFLTEKAHGDAKDAGYGGRYDDGGATHLFELICAYRSGRDQKIPAFWVRLLDTYEASVKQTKLDADREYQLFLQLKQKFEPKDK